jgi:hypothetical protein
MLNEAEEGDLHEYTALINDPQYAGSGNNAQPPSHTPPQTPTNLESEEDGSDPEEGHEPEEDTRSAELARIERTQREFEALSSKLSENGWKMRMKVYGDRD